MGHSYKSFLVLLYLQAKLKISVFLVKGMKILGGVGTHIFFNRIFFWKKILLYAF